MSKIKEKDITCPGEEDDLGEFIAARVSFFTATTSVKEMEAACLLQAMYWVRLQGFQQVEFEIDAKSVADAVRCNGVDVTEFGQLVDLCKMVLAEDKNFMVIFVRRQTNVVAYFIARASRLYASPTEFNIALSYTITPSKSMKDPEVIISTSGVFKLGFFSFDNSTNRYVGICYNHIPVQTVIWVANRDKPLKDSSGTVKISDDGNLVVLNGQEQILWSSSVTNSVANAIAQLLDSGNLVLTDNNNGENLWESFQHPSNAFMETMKIKTDAKTGKKVC
ncbi:hypothetical protein PTKIN_Ptkin14bG0223300 [Pterospermum kingtungense]